MIVLRAANYSTVPWKNGGGLTREILKFPPDTALFDWRLSLASIATPGPFSAFDGYQRTLVLMAGAGVQLSFGAHGETTLSAPGQTAVFDGAWSTSCTLIDGPSTDLNLMVAKARAEADARVARLISPELFPTGEWEETLVCCISGSARIENAAGQTATLSAADVARCDPKDGGVTCGPESLEPVLVFVANVRRQDT
jgi:environmental stress-induced protein Ves